MSQGKIKWFDDGKGYGFITPDGGGEDVFLHKTALERSGIRSVTEGNAIEYSVEQAGGKTRACDLRLL